MNAGILYRASSVERVMRSNVTSAASNDTAPGISSSWDTVRSSQGQDTERPRTYI